MGSLMLLRSIQQSTPIDQSIQISQLEMKQLIQGSDRLLHLMNMLLDHQAFSQAVPVLNRQANSLSAIAATVLQDFEPEFCKQDVQLKNLLSANLPLVNVDPQQIERVLRNLIGNAIHHNSSGLRLTLDAIPIRLGNTTLLKVIVQDNGTGIERSQQDIIFEPYTRGQQTQYRPGLGLGLYICRQVILAHGGEIGLESLHQETIFWFTLPVDYRTLSF